MSTNPQSRAWMEVRPGALRRNLRRIRESIGDTAKIIPMVKADGYGLGMEDVVRTLETEDAWGFGVATVEEGLRLRSAGVTTPVIIFNPVPPGSYDSAVAHDLTLTVSDLDSVDRVASAATRWVSARGRASLKLVATALFSDCNAGQRCSSRPAHLQFGWTTRRSPTFRKFRSFPVLSRAGPHGPP